MNILESTKKYKSEEDLKNIQLLITNALNNIETIIQKIKKEPS
jgi:hypothetical protein